MLIIELKQVTIGTQTYSANRAIYLVTIVTDQLSNLHNLICEIKLLYQYYYYYCYYYY